MAFTWAQLAFVEKWRLHAVRGRLVGLYRPGDRTFFDLRLHPGEGNVGAIAGTLDIHLQDAGDIVREKRLGLLDRAAVVIRVIGTQISSSAEATIPLSRVSLQAGGSLSGSVIAVDDDTCILDLGFHVVVQLPEPNAALRVGEKMRLSVSETPKGFVVV